MSWAFSSVLIARIHFNSYPDSSGHKNHQDEEDSPATALSSLLLPSPLLSELESFPLNGKKVP